MLTREMMLEAIAGYLKNTVELDLALRNIISYCETRLDELDKEYK